ncbi:MAG: DNA translocase FtsK 4TM domain-containing protein, partial [Alphaproteobacteria bacterium]
MAGFSGRSLGGAFLPAGMVKYLERLGLRLVGLVLFSGALLLMVALASYRPQDASLNTATDAPVGNALGLVGSVSADILLQTLGLAAALPVLCLAVWGARLMAAQTVPVLLLRVLTAPAAALLIAVGIAVLPKSWFWPLTARPGGFAGGLLLERSAELINRLGMPGDWRWLVALPSTLIGLMAFLFALGVAWSEWRLVMRGLAAAGRVTSGLALRLYRLARPEQPRERRAPRLGGGDLDAGPRIDIDGHDHDTGADGDAATASATGSSPGSVAEAAGDPVARRDVPKDLVAPRARPVPSRKEMQARQGSLALDEPSRAQGYEVPPLNLLELPPVGLRSLKVNEEALTQNARILETVLQDFGVHGRIVKVRPGPVVTLYELEPAPGTKTSRVIGLADDIARSMSALAVRIAVVPGQSVIGIELPNARRETVYLHEMMASSAFDSGAGRLMLALGKDIGGGPVYVDLARMPHLLIAGTTGSGKSVAINTMILSLLYRLKPAECRMIMIDPKMLELSVYDGIPHLLAPVVTDASKAVVAL